MPITKRRADALRAIAKRGGTPAERSLAKERLKSATKTAQLIALISRPKGATLAELMKAAGWQAHSVRGFIAGTLKKKLGLKIASERVDGVRTYTLKK